MEPEEFVSRVFEVMETPTGLVRLDVADLAIGKMLQVQALMDEYRDALPHVATTSTMAVPQVVLDLQASADEPPC